jgi:hypothetical protein
MVVIRSIVIEMVDLPTISADFVKRLSAPMAVMWAGTVRSPHYLAMLKRAACQDVANAAPRPSAVRPV